MAYKKQVNKSTGDVATWGKTILSMKQKKAKEAEKKPVKKAKKKTGY